MKLCFLELFEDGSAASESGGWVSAAVLVTDAQTRPLEFRVTDHVHVDAVQQALYGASFDEHLYGTVLTAPLLEALRESPDVILVRDQSLLALHGLAPLPVLWIGRDESDSANSQNGGGFVVGIRGDDDELLHARSRLGECVVGRDLLEPFERIATALERVRVDGAQVSPGA